MAKLAGVDGCRGGWVVVMGDDWPPASAIEVRVCGTFQEVLELTAKCQAVAIDIPIGLPGGQSIHRGSAPSETYRKENFSTQEGFSNKASADAGRPVSASPDVDPVSSSCSSFSGAPTPGAPTQQSDLPHPLCYPSSYTRWPRPCDLEARTLLGPWGRSRLFLAPPRETLSARNPVEFQAWHHSATGVKASLPVWGILPKIREVDEGMNPNLQDGVFEFYPELVWMDLSARYRVGVWTFSDSIEDWPAGGSLPGTCAATGKAHRREPPDKEITMGSITREAGPSTFLRSRHPREGIRVLPGRPIQPGALPSKHTRKGLGVRLELLKNAMLERATGASDRATGKEAMHESRNGEPLQPDIGADSQVSKEARHKTRHKRGNAGALQTEKDVHQTGNGTSFSVGEIMALETNEMENFLLTILRKRLTRNTNVHRIFVKLDDLLDALAGLKAAKDFLEYRKMPWRTEPGLGNHVHSSAYDRPPIFFPPIPRIPTSEPTRDSKGLRMEIWY